MSMSISYYYISLLFIFLLLPTFPSRTLPESLTELTTNARTNSHLPDDSHIISLTYANTNHKNSRLYATQHFTYLTDKPAWINSNTDKILLLTYAFSSEHIINYIPIQKIKSMFRDAFTIWSSVIPVYFMETKEYDIANIKIGFYKGDHGKGDSFDGTLGVLAHAIPYRGEIHFDLDEKWAVDFNKEKSTVAIDLESVAIHEIGHVLGLDHSSVEESVMYPTVSPRTKKVKLNVDDVEGIQGLYGSNPNFEYGSLLKPHSSSNRVIGSEIRTYNWVGSLIMVLLIFVL